MKRGLKYLILFIISCIVITGCSCSKEEKVEANQNVSELKYYVPSTYKNRSDLRGLIHTDDSRKIFAIGDTNDYSTFIYIDVIRQVTESELSDYINNINTKNLQETDVKFENMNHDKLVVYGRNGYETQQGDIMIINYAYLTKINNGLYTITISGPKDKNNEVEKLAKNVLSTLEKKTS